MSAKTAPEVLSQAVGEELVGYLRRGELNRRALTETLSFQDVRHTDLQRLKRLHFTLSKPVRDWTQKLPDRIRRIDREHQRRERTSRGELKGRINWSSTVKKRLARNPADRSQFVIEEPYTEYDTPENLLLKKLIAIVHQAATEDLSEIPYQWRRDLWTDEEIETLRRLYRRNVHLTRIREPESIQLSPRQLQAARQSRKPLYREAYHLYQRFQDLENDRFDQQEVLSLLQNTLVEPGEAETLFELFSIFRILRILRQRHPALELHPIEKGRSELARLESESSRIRVYHDQTGPFQFYEPLEMTGPPPADPYLRRYRQSSLEFKDRLETFLGRAPNPSLYSGRPDFLIVLDQKDRDLPLEIVVGEVKYSQKEATFSEGLRELSQYLTFCRQDETYLGEQPDVRVHGILVTDGVPTRQARVSGVRHLSTRDLLGDPEGQTILEEA